jgi:hypothetical protein
VEMVIEKVVKDAMMEIQVEEMDVPQAALLKADGVAIQQPQMFAPKDAHLVALEESVGKILAIQEVVEVVQMLMVQTHVLPQDCASLFAPLAGETAMESGLMDVKHP